MEKRARQTLRGTAAKRTSRLEFADPVRYHANQLCRKRSSIDQVSLNARTDCNNSGDVFGKNSNRFLRRNDVMDGDKIGAIESMRKLHGAKIHVAPLRMNEHWLACALFSEFPDRERTKKRSGKMGKYVHLQFAPQCLGHARRRLTDDGWIEAVLWQMRRQTQGIKRTSTWCEVRGDQPDGRSRFHISCTQCQSLIGH